MTVSHPSFLTCILNSCKSFLVHIDAGIIISPDHEKYINYSVGIFPFHFCFHVDTYIHYLPNHYSRRLLYGIPISDSESCQHSRLRELARCLVWARLFFHLYYCYQFVDIVAVAAVATCTGDNVDLVIDEWELLAAKRKKKILHWECASSSNSGTKTICSYCWNWAVNVGRMI